MLDDDGNRIDPPFSMALRPSFYIRQSVAAQNWLMRNDPDMTGFMIEIYGSLR